MATICDLKDEAKGLHYFYPGTLFIFLIRGEPGASGRGPRPSPLIEAGRDRRGGGLTAAGNKIYESEFGFHATCHDAVFSVITFPCPRFVLGSSPPARQVFSIDV